MKLFRAVPLLLLIISLVAAGLARPREKTTEISNKPGAGAVSDVPVYVSDFDVDALVGKQSTTPSTRPSGASADSQKVDTPKEQANALVHATSEALVSTLEKAGYKVQRMRTAEARPLVGMQIRGVFAESDEQNRLRRLLVGGVPVTPKMLLFVGVANLGRPEQPLYELADPPSPDPRHGPVITVTAYAPAARFELDRKPADEDLKKIARQFTDSFTALVNANPLAISH